MHDQGSYVSRIMGGLKGALGDLGNINNVGPKSQNGGEVIISPGMSNHAVWRGTNDKMANASIFTGCKIRWITPIFPRLRPYSGSSPLRRGARQVYPDLMK